MPTYEYVCQACSHEFELFQQMSDAVKRKCPQCGKLKLQRLIGIGSGVIFKGGGFYETDYRSDSYKKAAEAEGKSSSAADTKSETKAAGSVNGEPKSAKPKEAAQAKSTSPEKSVKAKTKE